MRISRLVRETHRWVSVAFTVAVLLNIIWMIRGEEAVWVGLLALFPLIFLLLTGLYLFVFPYLSKGRGDRQTG